MKKLLIHLYFFGITSAVFAKADTGSSETIETLLGKIATNIVYPFVNFFLVLATVVFLWGVIQYVIAGDSSDKTEKAKRQIVWGLIGLTVMASAWAIVGVIQKSLNF